ncbi:MAG: glycosyltransferase [Bacteroidales bacterium]|nr:glycosyltransferase [Bacteroidales bacterium]
MITIVVPVYNIEAYLEKCIVSLLAQTYGDLEIILVDDGSTDTSGVICDRFCLAYPDKIRVIHSANRGLSAARNIGVNAARGGYIGFVDGDDWVEPEMFEVLAGNAKKSMVDLSICSLKPDYTEDGADMQKSSIARILSKEELMMALLTDYQVLGYACNKLFRTDLVKKVLFDETLFSSEDIDFCVRYSELIDCAVSTPSELYHYRQRIGSMTGNFSYSFRKLSVIKAYENILPVYRSKYPGISYIVEKYLLKQYLNILGRLSISKVDDKELISELNAKIKLFWSDVMKEKRNSYIEKANIVLTRLSPGFSLRLKQCVIKRRYQ